MISNNHNNPRAQAIDEVASVTVTRPRTVYRPPLGNSLCPSAPCRARGGTSAVACCTPPGTRAPIIYIYIYTYIHIRCVYIYIYIYTYRERERRTYIYIYIYI